MSEICFFYFHHPRNPVSLMVSVTAWHYIGPGSIPTTGKDFSQLIQRIKNKNKSIIN